MKKAIALIFAALCMSVLVSGCAAQLIDKEEAAGETAIVSTPAVMVDGKLYYSTGEESTKMRCGVMDGTISSSVDMTETPGENGQSNFGVGYGYQYGEENTIEVNIDGKWAIFKCSPKSVN